MGSTWINDPLVEQALFSAFEATDKEFSTYFEGNSLSNEERLTGVFAKILIDKTNSANSLISTWGKAITSGPWYIKLYYTDMTVRRGEKKRGADLAFVLDVKMPSRIEFKKAILLQAKKMESRQTTDYLIFENKWKIDLPQAEKIHAFTHSSFHLLYNPGHDGLGIRVLPSKSVAAISKAKGNSTVLHTYDTIPSTRKFAEFMLYDFIGCWVGDFNQRIIRIAEGADPEFLPNHLVRVIITEKPGLLD